MEHLVNLPRHECDYQATWLGQGCCEHVMSDKEEKNANLVSLGENSRETKADGFYE